MTNQFSFLYLVRALAIATALLMAVAPAVLSSNTNSPNFAPEAKYPSSRPNTPRVETSKSSVRSEAGSSRPAAGQRKPTRPQQRARGTCDPQTKNINGVCTPTKKILALTDPIIVNVGDPPYDCGGRYLVPPILGNSNDPANDANRYQAPSSPQVAFFVPDAHNAQIRNCKIIGFDFGIFAIKGKTSAGSTVTNNIFTGNEIIAHYAGISVLSVDNTEVTNNKVTLTHIGGRAINVQWDSDRNTIRGNTLTGDFVSTRSGAYVAPSTDAGRNLVTVKSNPSGSKPQMGFIGTLQAADLPMLTAVVNGDIHQFRIGQSPVESDFAEDNIFDSNTITINLAGVQDGLLLGVPRRTMVKSNTIHLNSKSAIRVATQLGASKPFPGTCSGDPGRHCFDNSECNLSPAADPCLGTTSPQLVSSLWTSVDNTLEGNNIYAPFTDIGIATAGRNTRIIGNTIDLDPQLTGTPSPVSVGLAAIALFGDSFGNSANPGWGATVTRNTVSNVWPALGLITRAPGQPPSQEAFTARIGLNDFYTVYWLNNGQREPRYAVRVMTAPGMTPPDYVIPTDISINFSETIPPSTKPSGFGNFWAVDCPKDPTKADWFFASDVTPTLVTVNGAIASGVVIDDSKALADTVVRTVNLFLTPSPQPSRCPRPTPEP